MGAIEYYKNLSLENLPYINEEGLICWEEFKDIPDYEEFYQVSDLGRVKSLSRLIYREYDSATLSKKERILKGSIDVGGYPAVNLYKGNGKKSFKVHRLVMTTFKGKSDEFIDHKDDIRYNSILSNLRYCTQRENNTIYKRVRGISEYMGVRLTKEGKWNASIRINNKCYNLGNYIDEVDAANMYKKSLSEWEELKILPNYIKRIKTSRYKYVTKNGNKWEAKVKNNYIGVFLTEEEAHEASMTFIKNEHSSKTLP